MRVLFSTLFLVSTFSFARAQDGKITLDQIFRDNTYAIQYPGQSRWIDDGEGYTTLEPDMEYPGSKSIIRYNTKTGEKTTLVSAKSLIPDNETKPLSIHGYHWSADKSKLLVFTNSKRVWRRNTRGDYWVKDLETNELHQLGKSLPASSLMFAKFSPDNNRVAYVSHNNLYMEYLADHKITALTNDGTDKVINGTFDWAYEEEFGCRDGFRWSQDGKKIAYWQLEATGIRDFLMINNTDSLYPFTIPIQYPKVGTTSSSCRVGVLQLDSKTTTWMKVTDDTRNNYIPRMNWAGNSEEIVLQQLNRHQNTNNITICNTRTGQSKIVYIDKDPTWVDVVDDMRFLDSGKSFTWLSEKNGWNNLYRVSRDGQKEVMITPDNYDVVKIDLIDEKNGWVYYTASPENATQRYLYRVKIDGRQKVQRISPEGQKGTHQYDISPNGKWAFHTFSNAGTPPVTSLVSLSNHKVIKVITDNESALNKLKLLDLPPQEFFTITSQEGVTMDGFMIKPPNFDPGKKYPVLFFVYGEPAGQTVLDKWGGRRHLYHQLVAQHGYLVVSIDNRGTPAPKGRQWRKSIYAKLGVISSSDQAGALRALLGKYPFIDESRIGIWGWSGGGSMTLNALFRYPDIYKMGISVAPVSNIMLYDNIYQERYCGLPSEKQEEYYKSSPVNFAKNLEGKLLLIHGTGDDNVHYQSAEVLINELIRQNKIFSFMSYPNRSHGIFEGENTSRHLYGTMLAFIKENL